MSFCSQGSVPPDQISTFPIYIYRHKGPLLSHAQYTWSSLYRKMRCFWENLQRWQKFYTAARSEGRDKSHLWVERSHMILNLIDWLKALNEL